MDKIIDGVNVSECKYCASGYFCNKPMSKKYCYENTDCEYKQLKRLEQENNSLQAQLNNITVQSNNAITALEQENEQLKKEVETWNYQADKRAELSNIWFNTAEKYKQSLQEIRDIAREQLQDVSDRCINTTPMYIVHKHIIDKINLVIGAE